MIDSAREPGRKRHLVRETLADAYSDPVRDTRRAGGDQRGADVFLLGAGAVHQP